MRTTHLERPGCTCRAAGDPAAYMHDEGCPARDNATVLAGSGQPNRIRWSRNQIRAFRVCGELHRLSALGGNLGIHVSAVDVGVRVFTANGDVRDVDGLAALGLLIELPDGAGTQAAWAALLTLPEIT